jgi:hypothetical protein
VAVVGFTGEDVAEDVSVLDALAAENDGALVVIETVRHRFTEEADRLLHHVFALDFDDVVGVVEPDAAIASPAAPRKAAWQRRSSMASTSLGGFSQSLVILTKSSSIAANRPNASFLLWKAA